MQKVTVTVDGVEKELINLNYKINSNANTITINGQSYLMVDSNPPLCLDYNGNEIFKGDRIIAIGKVIFNKYVIVRASTVNEHYHYFTTEEAADDYIKANKPFTITTHDGVEVKEGDKVVIVNIEMRKVQSIVNKQLIKISLAIFSTDTDADNYIRENKPCLSLKMVKYELEGGGFRSEGWPIKTLSALVDSIIKSEGK